MTTLTRILDANANRAREALRVMEEAARFILEDPALASDLKTLRHELANTLQNLPDLSLHRDTPGDVGTSLHTASENTRHSLAHVVLAASKRLSEALRCLEEYTKLVPHGGPRVSARFKALRYRGYTLEQSLHQRLAIHEHPMRWRLCVLLSDTISREGNCLTVAKAAIQAAVKSHATDALCLQLREKTMDGCLLLSRARQLVKLCKPLGISVIVNDRPDIAMLSGADGVHLGQTDLPCHQVRKLVGSELLIGVSTSNLREAEKARRDGADYCGVGPMFSTTTKRKDIIIGPRYLKQYVRRFPQLPHLAIGGITLDRLPLLQQQGVHAVAVASAVCSDPNPAQVVGQFLKKLK